MSFANEFANRAVASLGALFVSWIFVSAALGPVLPTA